MTRTILISLALLGACKKESAKSAETAKSTQPAPTETAKTPTAPAADKVAIAVTEAGFEPADIKVTKGQPITLVFERKTDKTCAKEVILHVDDKQTIEKELPLNQPVEVAVTFPTSGDLTYACAMDMVRGSIHVQ